MTSMCIDKETLQQFNGLCKEYKISKSKMLRYMMRFAIQKNREVNIIDFLSNQMNHDIRLD